MIKFINQEKKDQFSDTRLNPVLRAIILLANGYSEYRFGVSLIITSLFREDDDGVHGFWRGGDVDNDHLLISQKKEIESYLNWLFIYDSKRRKYKVCLHHTVTGRGGDHLHIQVHPNTKLNGKEEWNG